MRASRVVALLALLALALGAWSLRRASRRTVRLAVGAHGGHGEALGRALAEVLRTHAHVDVRVVTTRGSGRNLGELEAGHVDLALVPGHDGGGAHARLVAPLYTELLQVVARRELHAQSVAALRGRRVGLGLVGGGSDTVGRAVLDHFGLGARDAVWVHVSHDEAIGMLHRGALDAMCVLAALPSPAVGRALASPEVELVGLGDVSLRGSSLDGVRYDVPFARGAVVPEREYGARPERAIGTVGVPVLLVAHERVDAATVTAVAMALFEHRHDLARHDPLLARVTERFDPAATGFALHPGVVAWLRRGDAPSLVRWADTMSLALTLAVLVFSATRELRRRRREARHERIDGYVLEVLARCEKVPSGEAERAAWREGLHALQRQVCDEVLSGRLRADDAFTAFQGLVDEALAEADDRARG